MCLPRARMCLPVDPPSAQPPGAPSPPLPRAPCLTAAPLSSSGPSPLRSSLHLAHRSSLPFHLSTPPPSPLLPPPRRARRRSFISSVRSAPSFPLYPTRRRFRLPSRSPDARRSSLPLALLSARSHAPPPPRCQGAPLLQAALDEENVPSQMQTILTRSRISVAHLLHEQRRTPFIALSSGGCSASARPADSSPT